MNVEEAKQASEEERKAKKKERKHNEYLANKELYNRRIRFLAKPTKYLKSVCWIVGLVVHALAYVGADRVPATKWDFRHENVMKTTSTAKQTKLTGWKGHPPQLLRSTICNFLPQNES